MDPNDTSGGDQVSVFEDDALYFATQRGDIDAVRRAIAIGVDLDHVYNTGATLLQVAFAHLKIEIVQLLLKSGANVDACRPGKYTLLMESAMFSRQVHYHNRALFLIELGADVNKRGGPVGDTPLILAALQGNTLLMEALIAAGADVFATDDRGKSVLEYASMNHDPACREVVERAMKSG